MRAAVLDLGTNTFHLLIAEQNGIGVSKVLFRERRFVKIGQGGITQGFIAEDAYQRALDAMVAYSKVIKEYAVEKIAATATSAIRNAKNGDQLLKDIKEKAEIVPQTITGAMEAELIFEGVKSDIALDHKNALVMDIGGGSVEFIIGNETAIYWKQSFEIGAQRLYDLFHDEEPIGQKNIESLENYLNVQLQPLIEAIAQFKPQYLIGTSGTFDTVWDVWGSKAENRVMTYEEFFPVHQLFISKTKAERLQIKGMLAQRVEMIVVASCLLNFIFKLLDRKVLKISNAALKEGVLARLFAGKSI